ncbi:MAG: Eco57I restriction-modification methylase domain-containing protein, partial [Smithella sp.]
FLPLELFHAYFNKDGDQLAINDLGFSGVIGNPPWENIKPIIKEFASFHADIFGEISKFSIASKDFDTTFKKALKENGKLKEEWLLYCHDIQELSKFIRNTYELYGDSGDLSYQKLFLERAINLTKNNGVISFLVPSGFHTDEGQKDLRRSILSYYTLKILMSFENRGHKWFHDIDPRFKFDSIIIRKTRNDDNLPIKERFYIQDIQEIENPLSIYSSDIIKFSPSTLGFVEFRNQRDMEIATKIRGEHQFLGELGYRLSSEFHMTNDNDLFCDIKKKKDNGLILYEGKMFHQYNSEYELPRYCILKDDGRERLISKEIHRIKRFLKKDEHEIEFEKDDFNKNKFKLIYEDYRLSYRAVASSTNERTLIAAILPPNIFTGHSINFFMNYDYKVQSGKVIQTHIDYKDLLYLQALINSFTVDYYIRLRVSANVTMFFIFEIPMPNISKPLKDEIVRISLNLLPNTEVFEKFANQLGISKNNMSESEKRDLRALLEAKIARDIYKLTIEETEYILDTFTFGNIDKELIDNIKKELK